MTPYYSDDWLTILEGDCREVMATMEPESVHCVVTSPPYWGLRDYGTATWLGGDEGCDHRSPTMREGRKEDRPKLAGSESTNAAQLLLAARTGCGKCGAIRQDSQLGLEPTPEAYVESMVAVFREVRRVLRADGTVWVNLGDCYNSNPSNQLADRDWGDGQKRDHYISGRTKRDVPGLKPKDLVGIPWRVAFALQADGWYLRSDIIWAKPNPMPESVTDRPTKAHEYLFLLSKRPTYFFDADAVREPHTRDWAKETVGPGYMEPWQGRHDGGKRQGNDMNPAGRNLRSVWSIATQPYPGAHFATFPEKLVEPCILAGTSAKGVCPECGAPWVRESVASYDAQGRTTNGPRSTERRHESPGRDVRMVKSVETTGWHRSCGHEADPVPATIADPFAGSGTVGRVAARLSRRAVLIDLNADYLGQAMKRNQDIPLGLESA